MPVSRGDRLGAPGALVRGRLPLLVGVVAAVLALVAVSFLFARSGDDDGVAARAPGAPQGDVHGLAGDEGEGTSDEGAGPGEDPGDPGDAPSPAVDAGEGDPPPPQQWEPAVELDDPIAQGVAAVEERSEVGVDAYRAAVRATVPATRDVPDALLDDYPETICVVAEQDPVAVPEVIDALRASGQIDPDVASFLTAAAVAAACPEHLGTLPG